MRLDVPPSESDEPLVPANDLSSSSMNRIAGKSIPLFSRRYADLPLSVPPLNHHRPVPYLTATAVDLRDVVLAISDLPQRVLPELAFLAEANRTLSLFL